MINRIEEIRGRCEAAVDLLNDLHRERLEHSEYVLLMDAVQQVDTALLAAEQAAAQITALQARLAEVERERDAQLDVLRKRLHGLSYESGDWSHGEHARVVELDEIDDLFDEWRGPRED